ncbi:FAD-dependent monooxygenase [Rhizobium leguminosarum]|uniref:FAD-dependent monooxygenase n=1 Tax=Rhizobium leguminosarum TaxID=384 RepID=UPI002484BA40|nr:FAD-dependent monooxygenase [Rhizobium leguminosarum]
MPGNHFAWFGTTRPFDTLTQSFVETNFSALGEEGSARLLPGDLPRCSPRRPAYRQQVDVAAVPRLWCDKWEAGRHVLLGDAAHTTHFSINSGTRLAMEDAIALVSALAAHEDVDAALAAYQAERSPIARKIVKAANTSANWYDGFASKMRMEPLDFAFDYMTCSGRVDMDRLRKITPQFMARYDASKASEGQKIGDPVGDDDVAGAVEIGFDKTAHPNCSSILWDNLARNPDELAVIGPIGSLTYAELVAEASRWGNAFIAAGLQRGERIPFFLDDTSACPAAFFGAVRAGFVPFF